MSDLFNGLGVPVRIGSDDDFLKVRETLTRMGISNNVTKTLWQSCHILHKRDKDTGESFYAIVHFKEMFLMDGRPAEVSQEDKDRRDLVVLLLSNWGMLSTVKPLNAVSEAPLLKVIPFKQKEQWNLVAKYQIGKK